MSTTDRLATYTLAELYDLETQAMDLLATIKGAIADRTPNLAALVTGYEDEGKTVLPAVEHHRFATIQRSR